jgi:hypothetical protein
MSRHHEENHWKRERLKFVQGMILKLRTVLLNSDPTVASISIDGDSTSYNWEQANKMLQKFEDEEKSLTGRFSAMETIDMSRM